MRDSQVTIIGAGLSGIMAAQTLKENGVEDVQLIDKGKSVGGRLATRRISEGKADHGAQFFTVRSPQLQKAVDGWLNKGWIKHWYGDPYPRYTSVDGMNSLAKRLAIGLNPTLQTKVTKVEEAIGGFRLSTEDGETCKTGALMITAPLPQTIQLLESSTLSLDSDKMNQARGVTLSPAFVGLLQLNQDTSLPPTGRVDEGLPVGVERIVDHKKKGISNQSIVSIYMDGRWSERHFDGEESSIIQHLRDKTNGYVDWSQVTGVQIKRWRYAQSESIIRKPFLSLHKALPLYIAGDTFLHEGDSAKRTRFESAYLSGIASGEHLSQLIKLI